MTYTFLPRPEAHAMQWNELLPPLRKAVRDLLLRLDGAVAEVEQSFKSPQEVAGRATTATCFLVYGERGTGKTTVLLSAREAVDGKDENFFGASESIEAKKSANSLHEKGLVWLDILDLESLPPRANLLTHLLTRVRNALCSHGAKSEFPETTSILEEGAESVRHKLSQLIQDATVMWEDVHEPDTRNKSIRQIEAADKYAQYQGRFLDAMKILSHEVGRRRGSSEKYHPIVLPIDNIDRTPEHLQGIFKLAQLVASPYLWLVLAGDRQDVETFLERAYWKELISLGEGAGGAGKKEAGGEDEALAMARRQAAASSHKLLPPSHRIEVDPVKPKEVLFFCPRQIGDKCGKDENILDLLGQIDIPSQEEGPDIHLAELFFARKLIDTSQEDTTKKNFDEKYEKYLTQAGRLGLHLPARGVIDLWQLAYRIVHDKPSSENKTKQDDFQAETVARTMLRNLIAESAMSNYMARALQDFIITRDPNGATFVNFRHPNPELRVCRTRNLDFEYRWPGPAPEEKEGPGQPVRSKISVRGDEEILLFYLQPHRTAPATVRDACSDLSPKAEMVPSRVAAWLAVLHDILGWAPHSWVLRTPAKANTLVSVSHEIVSTEPRKLWWPTPDWATFLAQGVFAKKWAAFRSSLVEKTEDPKVEKTKDPKLTCPLKDLPRLLSAGWVACVLDTYLALTLLAEKDKRTSRSWDQDWKADNSIVDLETKVMNEAKNLYSKLTQRILAENQEQVFFARDGRNGAMDMVDWLERILPLLLSHLYVPMEETRASQRKSKIMKAVGDTEPGSLGAAWKANWPYVRDKIEKELKAFSIIEELPAKAAEGPQISKPLFWEKPEGPFADLHRLLNPSTKRST